MKRSSTFSLGQVVNEFIAENKIGRKLREINLTLQWEEMLGKTINRYTKKVYIDNGTLYVEVTSPVVKSELFMMREDIVRRLNERAGELLVKKIVFK
jgi:hypothetical protein